MLRPAVPSFSSAGCAKAAVLNHCSIRSSRGRPLSSSGSLTTSGRSLPAPLVVDAEVAEDLLLDGEVHLVRVRPDEVQGGTEHLSRQREPRAGRLGLRTGDEGELAVLGTIFSYEASVPNLNEWSPRLIRATSQVNDVVAVKGARSP